MIVVILLIGIIIYGINVYNATKNAANEMYTNHSERASALIRDKKPISILLLGIDTGAEGRIDRGNSDTMIVVTLNPQQKTTTMVSIPRDLLAQMIGMKKTNVQKINAAYNIGGSKMAKATVAKLLATPINYYATVNMGALEKIVNAVGGVTIDSKFNIQAGNIKITKGKNHLNGKAALAYTRMRYQDPEGDYGRQKRQQQVIKVIIHKLVSINSLTHYQKILNSISSSVRTDLNFNDMIGIAKNYRICSQTIDSDHIQGTGAMINGSSYQIASNDELNRVSKKLRKQLDLKPIKLNNAETRLNDANPNYFLDPKLYDYDTFGYDETYYSYTNYADHSSNTEQTDTTTNEQTNITTMQ
ncbi:MAG: LCP family protein [Candidatus Paralactobacillus gallistercoris]|uniref:LCP family protein n=1 Tax=Candidatus Paralactobacillus gallistercoris TaxID=2838724 RepID=A0A948WZF6_9LACO|nr:LCP family protein [Candidatus Paralactobacillus gallistercoris]